MTTFQAIILAIIEGITEFLPVSSTGHMILASAVMKVQDAEFAKTFEIVIQLGAIMAVAVLYIKRFFVSLTIYLKLIAAFIPTGVIGILAYKTIKAYLFNPFVVSIALIVGGIFSGFDRKLATEFSFLLAIPTMLAASGKDLWESKDMIHSENIKLLLIGGAVAFVFAIIAVKGFIAFVQKYGFKHFGYYRIILGILFLSLSLYLGINLTP